MVAMVSMVTVRSVANVSIVTVPIVCSGCSRCEHRQEKPMKWWQNHGWKCHAGLANSLRASICVEYLFCKNNPQFPGAESCSDVRAASTYSLLILISSLHPSVFFTLPSTRTRNDHFSLFYTHTHTHTHTLSSSRTLTVYNTEDECSQSPGFSPPTAITTTCTCRSGFALISYISHNLP